MTPGSSNQHRCSYILPCGVHRLWETSTFQHRPCETVFFSVALHASTSTERAQGAFCFTPAQVWRSLQQFCRLVSVVLSNLSFSTFSGRSAAQRPKVPNKTLCAALVHMCPPPGPFQGPLRV